MSSSGVDKFAEHLKKDAKRSGSSSKALKKSKSTKKVEPSPEEESDPVPSFGAKGRKVGNTPLTPTEEQLLNEYSFTTAGGLCGGGGGSKSMKIKGLAAAASRMFDVSASDLSKIHKCFRKRDIDGSGEINFAEFCEFIDAVESDFMRELCQRMVFALTDLDGDGQLVFDVSLMPIRLYPYPNNT